MSEARTRARIHALSGSHEDLRELLARQRRQLREARTVLADMTGGKHVYSPLELLLAPSDAQEEKGAAIASVKGAAHHYEHRRLTGVIEPPEPPDPEAAQEETPCADPEIAELHAAITARKTGNDTEDDLREIHNFITKRGEGEEDVY